MKKDISKKTKLENSSSAEGGKNIKSSSSKKRRKKSWLDYLLSLVIFLLLASGIFILLRPTLVRNRRQDFAKKIQEQVDAEDTKPIAFDPNANRLGEAEYDYFVSDDEGNMVGASDIPSESTTISEGLQYMTPIGRLEVPKLDVNIPLIKELDYYAMYYAASHWEPTVMPGYKGNSAIFIHRDSYDDYDFTDADELKAGDSIYVTYGGKRMRFNIILFQTIEPSEIMSVVLNSYQDRNKPYITLVTCTPKHVYSHRLLITAVQTDDPKPTPLPLKKR